MNKTETANQLRLAAGIIETGHPFEYFAPYRAGQPDPHWEKASTRDTPQHHLSRGRKIRPILATPPDNRPLHNPDSLTAEQVGIGYRLGLQDESANQPHEYWGGEWLQGTPSTVAFGSFQVACRVPLTVPWPEAKPDPYAELKATHAAGKVIQYRDANSGGAWSEWHDYDGGRGMAAPMPIDNNGGYREWRAKPETPPFQLPPPPPGMRWHREDGWMEGDLPQGYRPLVKGERIQLGDEGVSCWDGFAKFKDIIGKYPFEKARTTRPLTFTHEGKEWTYHRPGDPMPCDKYAKVEVLYADGKDCDGVLTANSLNWGLFFKPECRIIGWRYAETTKQVELGPEDVQPGSVIRGISEIETLVAHAMTERDPRELALGYLRYEALRKLGPARYAELCRKNIHEGRRFDELVDDLLTGKAAH